MNFNYSSYTPIVLIAALLVCFYFYRYQTKYFEWIKKYWFRRRTPYTYIKEILFTSMIFLLMVSLLDLRGEAEKVDSNLPIQKTIIIIDSSSSMLAEDVKPSRFKKSLMIARHFVKRAVGHNISVVLFSDIQKKLVPFTDDIDLLDSRIAGLESINIQNGGSNISQAIMESVKYFTIDNPNEPPSGNILLITDSEENDSGLNLDVPSGVNLGVVGVGTLKGGKIPIRDRYNYFRGFKKFNDKEVVTKLNEDYLKKLSSKVKNYRYWIVQSYNLPTDEIVSFFRTKFLTSLKKSKATIKPVLAHYLVIPALVLGTLSYLFLFFPRFAVQLVIVGVFLLSNNTWAQSLEERIKSGEATFNEKLKYSENLIKNKEFERAAIYIEDLVKKDKDNYKLHSNLGLAFAKTKKKTKALQSYQRALELAKDDEVKKKIRENVMKLFEESQKDKSGDDKSKDQKEGKQNQKKDNSKNGKQSKQQKKTQGDSQGKKQNKDKDKKDQEEKNKKGKEQSKQEQLQKRESKIKRKRKLQKVPAMVKQLLSDDRELQKKFLDTSTSERKSYDKKDW
ncbi:MAG: VWA domain-containing protein [Oligoflexia bacterium]|nr:VWA domain-containing protein [Oligoflexia bacterium]